MPTDSVDIFFSREAMFLRSSIVNNVVLYRSFKVGYRVRYRFSFETKFLRECRGAVHFCEAKFYRSSEDSYKVGTYEIKYLYISNRNETDRKETKKKRSGLGRTEVVTIRKIRCDEYQGDNNYEGKKTRRLEHSKEDGLNARRGNPVRCVVSNDLPTTTN